MMSKGLTYIELLIALGLIPLLIGLVTGVLKVQDHFKTTRDLQRLQDLNLINNALNYYFQNATSIDPDGPNLEQRGTDQTNPTIFVSVPTEDYKFPQKCISIRTRRIYSIYQTNKNFYQRIDGSGWIPINFLEINYPELGALPIDPVNDYNKGLYYLYAFQKNPAQYEISAAFESVEFRKGGFKDLVSNDGGNDENRFELGTNLNLLPAFPFNL